MCVCVCGRVYKMLSCIHTEKVFGPDVYRCAAAVALAEEMMKRISAHIFIVELITMAVARSNHNFCSPPHNFLSILFFIFLRSLLLLPTAHAETEKR